jgi:indolepyruvate ferredoxin oxidoreductase alpha subunit
MTGVANAVYNNTDVILVVLDNSTTAMTGHQPHPGTGMKPTGEAGTRLSPERILEALGVASVKIADPWILRRR